MELLTDELDGFNKSIDRLERLARNTDNIKIVPDTTEIEGLIREHLNSERAKTESLLESVHGIGEQISSSRPVPKLQLWLHYLGWTISMVVIGYLVLQVSLIVEVREKAFTEGRKKEISDLKDYFNQNPGHYESYRKWIKEKNSVPNQK